MPCVDAEYLRHSPGCFLHGASSFSVVSLSLMALPLSSMLSTPAQRPGEYLSGMRPQWRAHVRHSRDVHGHFSGLAQGAFGLAQQRRLALQRGDAAPKVVRLAHRQPEECIAVFPLHPGSLKTWFVF